MNPFTSTTIKAYTYEKYKELVGELIAKNATSGPNQTEALIGFTSLNQRRMARIDKTIKLNSNLMAKINQLDQPQQWWVITEVWCGDSAQILPILAAITNASENKISLNIVLRDDNPELIDRYLTNGGRAIPKMIVFEGEQELFCYGPRPIPAANLAKDWKTSPNGRTHDDFEKELHTWYAKDKSQTVQLELLKLLA